MDWNEVLIEAAKDGNLLILKVAWEKGANINFQDNNGWTALMYAKKYGHIEIVNFLKEMGAEEPEIVLMIQPRFDKACSFSEGLACVEIGGKWGYIDKTGKLVIQSQFDNADSFSEGLACVAISGRWGYIDKTREFFEK